MPAWLTLVIIVLASVALFVDHRRNVATELADAGGLDAARGPAVDAVVQPSPRRARVDGHRGIARRSRTLPVRRSERSAPRH